MRIRRFFLLCLTVFLFIFMMKVPIASANYGSQLKKQIDNIEHQRKNTLNNLQTNKNVLEANKKQQSSIINQVQELESQIKKLNYKIQLKQNSISTTQQNIQELKSNITMLQNRIKQRKAFIADRARAVYLNGGSINYLQLVLNARSFGELINRTVFVYKIAQQDHTILHQQLSDKQSLEQDQKALDNTLKQLKSDMANLKQMKDSLDSKKAKEDTLLRQLKTKASQIRSEITNQQNQADLFKQQEATHKKELAKWEAEQRKQGVMSSKGSNVPAAFRTFIDPAQKLEESTNIPTAITLAQVILESDVRGHLSELASLGKNLFGIKGQGPNGTIYLPTHEYIGGMEITIDAGFKKYQTYYQSMVDHAQLLKAPRFQYFLKNASSLKEYAFGIQDGGYATDPIYAMKLLSIIDRYGLKQYDLQNF